MKDDVLRAIYQLTAFRDWEHLSNDCSELKELLQSIINTDVTNASNTSNSRLSARVLDGAHNLRIDGAKITTIGGNSIRDSSSNVSVVIKQESDHITRVPKCAREVPRWRRVEDFFTRTVQIDRTESALKMPMETRPTAICLFCASSIEKLHRAIDSDLFNTFQDESTAETRIILNITQQRPNRASVLLLSSNPQDRQVRSLSFILDSYDCMRELEQQVDQLRSNREAIMGDLSSYCDLLREELQSILDVCETTGPVTNPPSPPLNAGSILNGAVGIRIEWGNIINFSGTSNSIYQGSGIGVRT
ncbi:hypothetical protein F5887DRAFT_1162199 [Amanita rubescens]|nr:hypothetical protein F5887DRAFT_1162199 [Amanita rubescens]